LILSLSPGIVDVKLLKSNFGNFNADVAPGTRKTEFPKLVGLAPDILFCNGRIHVKSAIPNVNSSSSPHSTHLKSKIQKLKIEWPPSNPKL